MKEDKRIVYTMRVKLTTKAKLDRLKQFNADVPWDTILEPILKGILLPKSQSQSTKSPPIIPITVKYSENT